MTSPGSYYAVSLSVSLDNPAVSWYERVGFTRLGGGGGDTSVTMIKSLRA